MSPLLLSLVLAADGGVSRMTLVFGGDVIPHDPVKYVARRHPDGWDHVLAPLRPVLERADFAIVNLETPIGWFEKPDVGEMIFNADPLLLGALKRAGVDVAAFANNHCLDQRREGIVSTREFLADAGLLSMGCDVDQERAWKPLIIEKDGLRLGLFGVTRWLNNFSNVLDPKAPHVPMVAYSKAAAVRDRLPVEPIVGDTKVEKFIELVKAYSAEVDALIVFIHWGPEYRHIPASDDRQLAKQMVDAGAFAIIGMHPHVLQPLELVDGRLVMFSLGNLVSNQDFDKPAGTKRDSLLLELELEKDDAGVRLASVHGVPIATVNEPSPKRDVQAVLIDEELAAIERRLAETRSSAERKELLERKKLATDRRARIGAFLPAGVLVAP